MNPFYFAPPVFFAIAFVFSMLGMGGSQLYIPILYWMGMDFKTEAIPLGMLLNVVNSASAAITYGCLGADRRQRAGNYRRANWARGRLVHRPVALHRRARGQIRGGDLGLCGHLFGRLQLRLPPGNRRQSAMAHMDFHSTGCPGGKPTWLSFNGKQDEISRCQTSLRLGAAGRGGADHRQGCDTEVMVSCWYIGGSRLGNCILWLFYLPSRFTFSLFTYHS